MSTENVQQTAVEINERMEQANDPSSTSTRMIPCRLKDGTIREVEESLLLQCGFYRQMYIDLQINNMDLQELGEIPLEIDTLTFDKVREWMEAHRGQGDPEIKEEPLTRERIWFKFTEFQEKFFSVSFKEVEKIVMAANFLDYKLLYTYCIQHIASEIKKADTPENIRKLLEMKDDLTAEEKADIERNNVWCKY